MSPLRVLVLAASEERAATTSAAATCCPGSTGSGTSTTRQGWPLQLDLVPGDAEALAAVALHVLNALLLNEAQLRAWGVGSGGTAE
jgi:hypothetical protein